MFFVVDASRITHSVRKTLMPKHVPITEAPSDKPLLVVAVHGGQGVHNRLKALGIRPGVTVTKISGAASHGATVIQHGRAQTALGNSVAQKVTVEVRE